MRVFKRTNYFDIGKNGTVDEFRAANKKAMGKRTPGAAQLELRHGAIQACQEGKPGNIQAILANLDEFSIKPKRGEGWKGSEAINVADMLLTLTRRNDDPSAVIDMVFEKFPEKEKQAKLDDVLKEVLEKGTGEKSFYAGLLKSGAEANADVLLKLTEGSDDLSAVIDLALAKYSERGRQSQLSYILNDAVSRNIGGESFYAALLKSGADANVENNKDFAGVVLANAIKRNHPLPVIRLLLNNGANFDDTRLLLQSNKEYWGAHSVESLDAWRKKIIGDKPAADAADDLPPKALELLVQLQEQVRELTEEVKGMKSQKAPAAANKASGMRLRTP